MASTVSLEEKFQAAVKAIQQLPNDGTFQPSNELKLTFYGLYKQATVGSCKEACPSVFNYVARAKWYAWDKYRSLSKEEAMSTYINEIRQILETMPQTNEVLELTQLIGPFYEFVDDQSQSNESIKKKPQSTTNKNKPNSHEKLVNGTSDHHHHHSHSHMNGPTHRKLVSTGNGPVPSSSPSSSSSISSSDVDEYYEDPSDRLPLNHSIPDDEIQSSNNNTQIDDQLSISNIPNESSMPNNLLQNPRVYGGQNETNPRTERSHQGGSRSSDQPASSTHSTNRHHAPSNAPRHSFSSAASGGAAGRHPNNNYNKETQRAILTALTKLQRDVNNILERLNRLETSPHFLQQREQYTQRNHASKSNALSRWLPLAGLRRRAAAFILLWPFFVFILIRLLLRARIIIRFRQPRL